MQDYLDTLKINFETEGETNYPPLLVVSKKKAHCFEGAVLAAAILAYHGKKPLLMDFETLPKDEDHTIALFSAGGGSASGGKESKHWGAVGKTNHAVLRYRDPVYASPRELAMSFFHEYYLWDGTKSMRAYSKPFDLSRYAPEKWITSKGNLDWLMKEISKGWYYSIVPPRTKLRKASSVELKALRLTEWKDPRKKREKRVD